MKLNLRMAFFKNKKLLPDAANGSSPKDMLEVPAEYAQTTAAELVTMLPSRPGYIASRGAVITCWNLLSPVTAFVFIFSLGVGKWDTAGVALFFLLTIRRLNRLAVEREEAYGALHAAHIGKEKVGALAEMLEWPYPYARGVARLLLLRLLPTLGPEDVALISEDQRHFLYHRLTRVNMLRDPELAATIIRATEHFDAAEAEPYLNKMARMWAFTPGARSVRRSAREALQRADRQKNQDMFSTPTAEARIADERLYGNLASLFADEELALAENPETSAEVLSVRARVDAQLQRFEEERRKYRPGMRLGFLIANWSVIVPYTAGNAIYELRAGSLVLCLLWLVLTLFATQLYRFTLTGRHTQLARELADMDEVEGVGRLTEVLEWPDPEIRNIAAVALTRLLPRLKASDATLLSPSQRTSLCGQLKMSYAASHPELLVAILKALEQIGDAECVPYVQDLTNTPPFSARQRKVRNAAVECLPYLMARAEQTQGSRTLLRASYSSGEPQITSLLRPASSVGSNTDHSHLVRAAEENIAGL